MATLQSGSGTGAVDRRRLTAQWRHGRDDLLVSAAYTRTGAPSLGDRLILSGEAGAPRVSDEPLALPDRLDLGVALRRVLRPRLALVVEATTALAVGHRTETVDAATPIDVVAGVQARFGGARLGVGLRYHAHSLPSGERRRSPIAGLVDVSAVGDAALLDWLEGVGAGSAAPHLRGGSQRLLAGVPVGATLPEGARVVAPADSRWLEHQLLRVVWAGRSEAA